MFHLPRVFALLTACCLVALFVKWSAYQPHDQAFLSKPERSIVLHHLEDNERSNEVTQSGLVHNKTRTVFHLIPHSHCDAAYKKTFEEYHETETRNVLNSVLLALSHDKSRRFVWAETSFLTRWWKDPRTSKKQKLLFHDMLVAGKLELVNGGWVMHDEAITRYDSQIHQMTEGHNRLQQMLLDYLRRPNASVTTGWQIDPFGPSPFTVNLHVWADMDFLVLNRIPDKVKDELKANKTLQFYWETEQARILVHVMDTHYESPQGFDWENVLSHPIPVTRENVRERSDTFMKLVSQRAAYYRTSHVMVPMGGDFRFQNASLQFRNMERITNYVQSHPELYGNATFRYSTPKEFIAATTTAFEESQQTVPTIRGGIEFQPYWTGYYFQLPNLKQMLRNCEIVLRTVDVRLYQALNRGVAWSTISKWMETIRSVRETVSLLQHHDAITATSYRFVIADYMQRLYSVFRVMGDLLSRIEENQGGQGRLPEPSKEATTGKLAGGGPYLHETILIRDAQNARSLHVDKILSPQMGSTGIPFLVLNSLGQETTTLIHFVCTRDDVALSALQADGSAKPIHSQATPLDLELEVSNLGLFLISFRATIPGHGRGHYRVQVCDLTWNTFQNPPMHIPSLECAHRATPTDADKIIDSGMTSPNLKVGFNKSTLELASLTYIREGGVELSSSLDHDFILYNGANDTIYQFETNLESSDPPPLFGPRPRRFVSGFQGPLFSQVTLEYTPWLSIRYRLVNSTSGPLDSLLQATVFAGPLPSTFNLASRFRTNWSQTKWSVDQNGFLPVQVSYDTSCAVGDGNTRPLVSRSWINEEFGRRLSVYTVDPRAVVSKRSGEMDVFWHRRNSFPPDWWKQGEDRSSVLSSVWIGLSQENAAEELRSRQWATKISNDAVLLSLPALVDKNMTNAAAFSPPTILSPSLHSVTLRVVQVDPSIDPDREEAWIDLQIENLSATSSEKVDLAVFFHDLSKIVLPAATLTSLTFLVTKSDARAGRQGSFDGCSLDVANGGKSVLLTIDVRQICSVRVPVSPLLDDVNEERGVQVDA